MDTHQLQMKLLLTYSWTCPLEEVTVHAVSIQEVLIAGARDPHQRAWAVQCTHVYMQCPHVVTYHVAVHCKQERNWQHTKHLETIIYKKNDSYLNTRPAVKIYLCIIHIIFIAAFKNNRHSCSLVVLGVSAELTWGKPGAGTSSLIHSPVQKEVNMTDRDGNAKIWFRRKAH